MNIRLLALSTAAVALLGAGAAGAASYTFDFTQDGNFTNQASHMFDSVPPGLTVTVTGSHYSLSGGVKTDYGSIDVEANPWGLISCNSGESCGNSEHAIDSYGPDEIMHFAFSEAVTLTGITLGWWAGSGYYTVFSGDTQIAGNSGNSPVAIPAVLGNDFSIGARWHNGRHSYIKIKSITVDYTPSTVPLPAGGVLLLTAFGGMAALRRKRKA